MITKSELRILRKKVKWGKQKSLPFSQGWVINDMIKRYKIPAVRWGYDYDVIGIETKKQFIFWKDNGGTVDFLGLLDK